MIRYLLASLVVVSLFVATPTAEARPLRRVAGAAKKVVGAPVRLLKRAFGCGG